MASKSKKGVSKDELKRLMKQQKTEGSINHPFAKYNALGHLICTVCNCQVKSDRLWNPHLMSRSHKEMVAATKTSNRSNADILAATKRQIQDYTTSSNAKRLKVDEKAEPPKPKGILKNSLVTSAYSSDDDSEAEMVTHSTKTSSQEKTTSTVAGSQSALPADFFDSGVPPLPVGNEGNKDAAFSKEPSGGHEALPEGFFDDPKADAKARNVEYVEKEDVEWERFQTEMKQEAQISEQIEAEEDFAITEERHIEEVEEQLAQWSRVDNILKKKERLMEQLQVKSFEGDGSMAMEVSEQKSADMESEDDVDDIDNIFDWRTKKV